MYSIDKSKREFAKILAKDILKGTSKSVDFLLDPSVEKTLSAEGIKNRKFFAPALRAIYKTQSRYKLVKDKIVPLPPVEGDKGRIFVVNHVQADDVVLGVNVVAESGYVVFGNKYLALDTPNGLGLWAYGVILLDRDNEENRKAAYDKMKFVIENGGNVIIYPEGYWNLDDDGKATARHAADGHNSENWLMQDFNIGAFRLAQETGCEMVPTVLHYDEVGKKRCYGQRGNIFKISKDDDVFAKKDELRDQMVAMKFEMMEKYSSYSKEELERKGITMKEQWEKLKAEKIAACDIPSIGYKLDLADEKLIGKAKVVKPVLTSEEVFAFKDKLLVRDIKDEIADVKEKAKVKQKTLNPIK